jgi:RNA polymerase sigma-70 factor (ECF subfamily)
MAHTDFSDSAFLERLRKRDQAALAELVDAYLPQLLHAGRGMGFSREEAEDLVQSVFPALIESVGRFQGRSHIRTFLFGVFYNKVAEHLREKQRTQRFDPIDPIDEVMESRFDARGNCRQPGVDIEKQLLGQEIREIIQECLQTIPRAQRIAFYLREIEEMKTPEICKKMGITATNLGVLLFRARKGLCLCVEQKGIR